MSSDVCVTSETTLEGSHNYSNTVDSCTTLNDHEDQHGGSGNEQNNNFQANSDCRHLLQEHTHAHQQQHVQYHQTATQLHEQSGYQEKGHAQPYQNTSFHLRDNSGQQHSLLPPIYVAESQSAAAAIPVEMLAQLASSSTSSFVTNNQANYSKTGTKKARRKFKPSNVWNHFLRLSDGNVHCVHCGKVLKRKDSSTKTMWGHLRAIHYRGRDWIALQEESAERRRAEERNANENDNIEESSITADSAQCWLEKQLGLRDSPQNDALNKGDSDGRIKNGTPPHTYYTDGAQVYIKPTRYAPYEIPSPSMLKNRCQMDVPVRSAQNGQNAIHDSVGSQTNMNEKSDNVLSMISHSSEVINITAGFNGQDDEKRDCNGIPDLNSGGELGVDCSTSVSSSEGMMNRMDAARASHSDQSLVPTHPYMFLAGKPSQPLGFSIMDGEFVLMLMRIAAQMDYTLSFHCRGGQAQFCFEPNSYGVERKRGPEVALIELGSEVRVVERNSGVDIDSECWRKIDRVQFLWAVRGKCQQVFLKK